ncbi:MAG: hypothetical protein Tsb0033_02110 [Winogradskyella sp.]
MSTNLFSQNKSNATITYGVFNNVQVETDTIKESSLKKMLKKLLNKADDTDQLLYNLEVNGNNCKFSRQNTLGSDEFSLNVIELELKTRGTIHTELNEKLNYTVKKEDKILIRDSIDFKWKLSKETKRIGNYTCFKATGIRKLFKRSKNKYLEKEVIAWYTPEISIASGP